MKKCPTCEGVGSIPDSMSTLAEDRRHTNRSLLEGWLVLAVFLLIALKLGCPHGCAVDPAGRPVPAAPEVTSP